MPASNFENKLVFNCSQAHFSAIEKLPVSVSPARLAALLDKMIVGLMAMIVLTLAWPVSMAFRAQPSLPKLAPRERMQSLPGRGSCSYHATPTQHEAENFLAVQKELTF